MNKWQIFDLVPEEKGKPLSFFLEKEKAELVMPCAGNHKCGKCKVKASGSLSPMSASEAALLKAGEIAEGFRLACFAEATGPVHIEIPSRRPQKILKSGVAHIVPDMPLFRPGEYGVAIDIGTTTLVCCLYNEAGQLIDIVSQSNHQAQYGADVISRIHYGMQHGNATLQNTIQSQLEEMLETLAAQAGIQRQEITAAAVTGNTTMMHFFAGLDPRGIGFAPFIPESLFDTTISGLLKGIASYIPPCISAYVGADLVCAVVASEMTSKPETSAIVDIGTNGEMALFHEGTLLCCSTAAGPAFEGAGISHGMNAEDGAISNVSIGKEGTITYSTINDAPARGFCGSGVVDIVSVLLDLGFINDRGYMEKEYCIPGTDVCFSQEDVRKVQLAKAAIHGGLKTLLETAGLSSGDFDKFYVCGGFGTWLNISAAENIGLLLPETAKRVAVLGNGAAAGAAMALMRKDARSKLTETARDARYIELSSSDLFMEEYIDAMSFRPILDEDD